MHRGKGIAKAAPCFALQLEVRIRSPEPKGKVSPRTRAKKRLGMTLARLRGPRRDPSTQGAVIIRRHRFDRFRKSDFPGSGSCHQAHAWRLSSGLPRPRTRFFLG